MLILTRRAGETLMIGENITVTVCAINGNQVKARHRGAKGRADLARGAGAAPGLDRGAARSFLVSAADRKRDEHGQ
jgi:hypothetical protein